MKTQDLYKKLQTLSQSTTRLDSVLRLLEWDQETYMPKGAIGYRALQIEDLASLVHKQKTSVKFAKALSQLIDIETGEPIHSSLSPAQLAAVKHWRRDYLMDKKLPTSFVKNFAKTTSNGLAAWAEAKEEGKFSLFAPHLEKIVALCKKKASLLGYTEHPYDALLDVFEPGLTVKKVTPLFERLKHSLTDLLRKIAASPQIPTDFLHGNFAADKQLLFGKKVLRSMGFQDDEHRLDLSSHPFCTEINPKDMRLTTRIHSSQLLQSLFGVIHEGGHGLYHLGLPEEHYGTPLREAVSLGIDESQSLFWEKRIGRSTPFWKHFYPLLQKEFPEQLAGVYFEDFYRAVNHVHPSMTRVEADEVTYCLHVILRFEIEKALIEGSLKVKDVPQVWNEKMRSYLGISPASDREGCLQDIHWAMGVIGYFPTYALGNLYSVQLFDAFDKAHPEWKEAAAQGKLQPILSWLHDNIHKYGKQYSAEELIFKATGQPLSEVPFVHYLEKKYQALYHF